MNRVGRATLVLCLGVILARLLWTGGFGWFVQQRMRWPLLGAAVVLLVFGISEAVAGVREERRDPSSVERSTGPRVGWLLALPVMVLIAVAPTGLGAAAADRVEAYTPSDQTTGYDALDTSAGPPEMRVFEFLDRAIWDENRTLEGVPVRLEGLVVNHPDAPDGFRLTRFMVSCCAADGIPLQVTLHGAPSLPNDTWVIADVVWREPETPYIEQESPIVEADVVSLEVVPDPPDDPYESPF